MKIIIAVIFVLVFAACSTARYALDHCKDGNGNSIPGGICTGENVQKLP